MMAHNLCYTTLLEKSTIDRLNLIKDVDYTQTPNNGVYSCYFLQRSVVLTISYRFLCLTCQAEGTTTHSVGGFDICSETC